MFWGLTPERQCASAQFWPTPRSTRSGMDSWTVFSMLSVIRACASCVDPVNEDIFASRMAVKALVRRILETGAGRQSDANFCVFGGF